MFKFRVFALLITSCIFGCTATDPAASGAASGTPVVPVEYQVTVAFTPTLVTPGMPTTLTATVNTLEGAVVSGASASVSAANTTGSSIVPAVMQETAPGQYTLQGSTYPDVGTWTHTLVIVLGNESSTTTHNLEVACGTEGAVGAHCCDITSCKEGLACITAKCAEKLGPGAPCESGEMCITKLCKEGACAAEPTCDDVTQNGTETDVDCGGDTCGPCAEGKWCANDTDCVTAKCKSGFCIEPLGPLIGTGDGTPNSVKFDVILNTMLKDPAGLQFNPEYPTELWIVNRASNSFTVITDTGLPSQSAKQYLDFSYHFLEKVLTISFGGDGTMGTCGDTRNDYSGKAPPNNFMGPTMWPSNQAELAKYGTPDVSMAHLDMMHDSPLCMGIVAEGDNVFYTFNGLKGTIERYDFNEPHPDGWDGHGGEDHSDGTVEQYIGLGLKRVPTVPSGLIYDPDGPHIYIADTGNSRIVRFTPTFSQYQKTVPTYPGQEQPMDIYLTTDAQDFIPASQGTIFQPSGLIRDDKYLYVTDNANGYITAFDMEGGRVNFLDTGLGDNTVAGLDKSPTDGMIYFVDRKSNRILRIDTGL